MKQPLPLAMPMKKKVQTRKPENFTLQIKTVMLIATLATLLTTWARAAATEQGFKSLFNGKNLSGWDGNPKFWSVKEGAITGQTTTDNPLKGNTFLIWTNGELSDFELRCSFKIVANNDHGFGNSGIQYRSKVLDPKNWVVGGYQADFEFGKTYSGILYEERMTRGIMAARGEKVVWDNDCKKQVTGSVGKSEEIQAGIKSGDWNDYVVIAQGNHLQHFINGKQTVDVTDECESKRSMSGVLALQLHAGEPMTVQFRNLRVKTLSGGARAARQAEAGRKKIVFIAGAPSHGSGEHEHRAGCLLLKSCLDKVPGVTSVVYSNGWPADTTALEGADSIVIYSDGGGSHPALQGDHLQILDGLMKKGAGLACIHYATEPTLEKGQKEFLDWIGGAFEVNWSVNPHWTAEFKEMPAHPIARGVKPFSINDEWYFHIRFPENMKGVTPILTAVAPESTMSRANGPHEGNASVREAVSKGEPQHVAWACERADGGRGFGFTGAHFNRNWGDANFRKVVLNAILWTAKAEVPANGVQSHVTKEELVQNLDAKGK